MDLYGHRNCHWPQWSACSSMFIIIILIAFSNSFAESITQTSPSWLQIKIDDHVDNIVVNDEGLFVAVGGVIKKYASNFELSLTSANSTSKDTDIEANNIDIVNKLLSTVTISNMKGHTDILLSCWQAHNLNLKCSLYSAIDLRQLSLPLVDEDAREYRTDPSNFIKALQLIDNGDLLIVTSKTKLEDNTTLSTKYLPSIARFKLSLKDRKIYLEQKSVLPYRSLLDNSHLLYDYVYLFNHNSYTLFILNDIRKPVNSAISNNEVKIARICQEDIDLTSYTEISLTCNNQMNNIYAKIGYLDVTKDDPTLHIIFESLDDPNSSSKRINDRSLLCSYSMKLIEDLFNNVVTDCYKGSASTNLLSKMHLTQPAPCQRISTKEWCRSKTNLFIDGTSPHYNVIESEHIGLGDITSASFLFVTEQGRDTQVAFIGTESGMLIKVTYGEDILYSIDLNTNQVRDFKKNEKFKTLSSEAELIRGSTKYLKYPGSQNILAITSNGTMNQINMSACYYKTCLGCLSSREPLGCVWCGSFCSTKQDCAAEKQSNSSCPPIINEFKPVKGPLSGSTRLTISGENFGSSRRVLAVKLGTQICSLKEASISSEVVECLNGQVDVPLNVPISVEVQDESGGIDVKGLTTSQYTFSYVEVFIYGLNPSSGPEAGGTLIDIYGKNLDAGSTHKVFIGDIECDIEHILADKIRCKTKALVENNETTLKKKFLLRVSIDGHEQRLIFQPSFNGTNLSNTFEYGNYSVNEDHLKPTIQLYNIDKTNHFSYLIIILIVVTLFCLAIFFNSDKIQQLKSIIPKLGNGENELKGQQVSFRNPQSRKFVQTNPDIENSMNGVVKLNGSIMSSDYFGCPTQVDQDQPLMSNFVDNEILNLLLQEKILIDRKRLTLGHVLGSGQFGRVYKGFLRSEQSREYTAVAVKTLHNRNYWDDNTDNRAFVEEGLMMKDFEHENVLALIGVTFDSSGLPMVITPFMLYGDLRSYISDEASSPTVKELIDFGIQVAKGMAYLSGLKFVHRDLAARNCMLDENLTVKVADFGLSRDIYESAYYSSDDKKAKLPLKWMAIESLERCIYNVKTDVWSYGVLLWELMTRGVVPYPDVDNFDMFSYLREGRRMLRPRYCPMLLYKIMLSCWEEDPAKRPTFDELVQQVSDVITSLKIAKDGQQKVCRDLTYCDINK